MKTVNGPRNCLSPSLPTHAEIAQAAYAYWRLHGGNAVDNWLRCERELFAERLLATPLPPHPTNTPAARQRKRTTTTPRSAQALDAEETAGIPASAGTPVSAAFARTK